MRFALAPNALCSLPSLLTIRKSGTKVGYRIDTPLELTLDGDGVLNFIQERFIDTRDKTAYRGHQRASWQLKPTLRRFYERLKQANRLGSKTRKSYEGLQRELHKKFRENVLINQDLPRDVIDKGDLWQYGQHHGLPTPLLDWTYSPYVGLFFALVDADQDDHREQIEPRCLWALNLEILDQINWTIRETIRPRLAKTLGPRILEEQIPEMQIVDNIDGYNKRLAYQRGFFTKHIFYESFEVWAKRIADEIPQESSDVPLLTKVVFEVTNEQRCLMLRALDTMNINSRVLFPDIKGSADHARLSVEHRVPPGTKSFGWTRDRE